MAYSPINNNKFDSGDVIIGADIAQLNDNIEDTRSSVLNQYATVYEWSSHSEVGQTQGVEVGTQGFFTFETPTTTTYYGSKEVDFLTTGLPNTTGTVFGDDIRLSLYFDYDFSGAITTGFTGQLRIEYVMTDGTVKDTGATFYTATGTNSQLNSSTNAGSGVFGLVLDADFDFPAKIGILQSMRVMSFAATNSSTGATVEFAEKITPTKLEIKVNV